MATVPLETFPGSGVLIKGALPRGNYLLIGPSGVGKSVFCKNFTAMGLEGNEAGIYLSTDESCEKIRSSIQDLLPNPKAELRFIDAYSWRLGGSMGQKEFITVNPANLSEVSIACDSACQGLSQPRFVFDSISSLALHFDANITLKFLQIVTAKMRKVGSLAFFTLIQTAHDEKFLSTAKIMFDGIFEMRLDETGREIARLMRVFSLKGAEHRTDWIAYKIGEKGISFPKVAASVRRMDEVPIQRAASSIPPTREEEKEKKETIVREESWLRSFVSEVQSAKLAAEKGDVKETLKYLRAMLDERTYGLRFKDLWEEDYSYVQARYQQIFTSVAIPPSLMKDLARKLEELHRSIREYSASSKTLGL